MKVNPNNARLLASTKTKDYDPVHLMNCFYNIPEKLDDSYSDSVISEYWERKIAILCNRVCLSEKHLEEVTNEYHRLRNILDKEGIEY